MNENIIIIYLNNGNFESEVSKEIMFNRVVNDLIEKGMTVESTVKAKHSTKVLFNDGSKVEVIPVLGVDSSVLRGKKGVTNLYIDDLFLDLPESTGFVYNQLLPCSRYDKNALMRYSINDEELSVSKIFKEQ